MQGWFCKKDWSDQRSRRGLISQIGSFLFSDASECFLINLKNVSFFYVVFVVVVVLLISLFNVTGCGGP